MVYARASARHPQTRQSPQAIDLRETFVMTPDRVKLVDVGPRDGLQNEQQAVDAAHKIEREALPEDLETWTHLQHDLGRIGQSRGFDAADAGRH